ncbi:enolase C-terminal domain-like protein [Peredibacter starrii]|uniref:Enolase C-terminal domain-like protein n=1 Tax=Peredibacter starrii TaxID=28202 RepID=A0AAX4HSP3_9BACT|nr:enolase C-terminal domain-like protein [Peredibacter starrii]WPU66349.1 enolase C-terminal domain-like protein [Peredibacter starrii]
MRIWLEKIHLDLKVNWKLSRNQTTFKKNFIVHLETGIGNFRSEIAPNSRYGETAESIEDQFVSWATQVDIESIKSIPALVEILSKIKLFHSLSFGIESAFMSYLAALNNQSLSTYLSLPKPISVATSFSMPITPVGEIKDYLAPLTRFKSLKIKVDADTGAEMLQEIRKHSNVPLRVDANEGWKDLDQFMRFQETLKGMNIELIEQPFPSSMVNEYKELKKKTPYKLLADESIEDVGDFSELSQQFHAVNIKLMKTGSLLKAKELLLDAKNHNMTAMMGCMIETTIGISYGMLFGGMVEYVDLDGFLLIKDEPFKLVSEADGVLSLN